MKIRVANITNPGGRTVNDDTVCVAQNHGTYVFVGDGLGGYAGGQRASQAAAKVMMELSEKTDLTDREALAKACAEADAAVHQLQRESRGSMKTTAVFLTIQGETARWMHVGDTRLYHFREGKIIAQTMDHSVSQIAVMMGDITAEQIRFHEDRNRVLRALGADNAKPEISAEQKIVPGDAFLLCTDGFWEYVYEKEMEEQLCLARDPEQWLEEMEQILRSRIPADTDNYTAAAVIIK